tara:strand:- start:185 stop:460 length:276 start_codon:yes stop_codon:yes gene_type:complete
MKIKDLASILLAGWIYMLATNIAQADPVKQIGEDINSIAQVPGKLISWILDRPAIIADFVQEEINDVKDYQKKTWSPKKDQLKGFFSELNL